MNLERERKRQAKKLLNLPPGKLEVVDLDGARFIPIGMTRAYRNNRYTVMIFDDHPTTHGVAIRVMIQKHDDTPITFHWREMMKIKNDVFGEEVIAVEFYPKKSELIDDHNIYWMWIFPENTFPKPILNPLIRTPPL
jgi:hypothetical protein